MREDKLLKYMFVAMILFVGYITLLAPNTVKGATLSELSQTKVLQLEIEANSNYVLDECDVQFTSLKNGKLITPPSWFMSRMEGYDCTEKKILIRLAYYESGYNPEAKNKAFSGMFQIGHSYPDLTANDSTWGWCHSVDKDSNEEDCALYLYRYDKFSQFEVVGTYSSSFEDLI